MNRDFKKEVICDSVNHGMNVSGDYDCDDLWFTYCPKFGQKLKYTE